MTRSETKRLASVPSPARTQRTRPKSAIWSAHKPTSDKDEYHQLARSNPEAAKLTHDMRTCLALPIGFADYVAKKTDSESLREEASQYRQSLNTASSMLYGFIQISAPYKSQVAGMMAGMLNDLGPILAESLVFAECALERDDLPEAADRLAIMAVRNLRRAEDMLKQLKSASPKPRPKRPINVPRILQSVVEVAEGNALASGEQEQFSFGFSAESDLPSINGDSGALERVFLNLITNAVHAMPEGGKVWAKAKLHEGAVLVTISDSGIGMDDETAKRIFQPFFTTKGNEGTGLGLAVVSDIIKAHGGQVTVKSQLGEGTTFHLSFPKIA